VSGATNIHSVGRMRILHKEPDFEAFERVMVEAHPWQPIRILRSGSRPRLSRFASPGKLMAPRFPSLRPGWRGFALCKDCAGPRQQTHPILSWQDSQYRPN
jgi:hypothetical protein